MQAKGVKSNYGKAMKPLSELTARLG